MANERVDTLDWMRALAVAAVIAGHACSFIAPGGAVGVSVFFVLSGYFIASILLRDNMMHPSNIAVFVMRRIARIYPLYALHICVVAGFLWLSNPADFSTFKPYIIELLTFQNPPGAWVGYGAAVLWTLYVEFWFYVTFPLILFALSFAQGNQERNKLTCFGALGGACIAYKALGGSNVTWIYYDHFLIGAAVATLVRLNRIPLLFAFKHAASIGVVLIGAMILKEYPGERNLAWHIQSLVAALGTAIFILSTHVNPPNVKLPVIALVGRISYSAYLVHALVLDVYLTQSRIIPFWVFLVYGVIVIMISKQTYQWIEYPIILRAHRYLQFRMIPPSRTTAQAAVKPEA